jgi:hypothetical protein
MRSLLEDVLSSLSDGTGNRILKLLTPFGGGKSHALASLFHAARNRKALDVLPDAQVFPRPVNVRTVVFDGQFFDATKGKEIPGEKFRAQTRWGWIAWSLGGKKVYEMMRNQDEAGVPDDSPVLNPDGPRNHTENGDAFLRIRLWAFEPIDRASLLACLMKAQAR